MIRRHLYVTEIRLVEVSIGRSIEEISLTGGQPKACPGKIVENSPDDDYYGDGIETAELIDTLSEYVNPDGEIERLTVPPQE